MYKTQEKFILMVLEAQFPVLGGGGAESQVATLGKLMCRRGLGVEVIVPMVSGGPQVEHEQIGELRVTRIKYPYIRAIGSLVMLVRLTWLLFLWRQSYSVIHVHIANNMAAICAVAGALLHKRVIVKLTGMHEMKGGILDRDAGITARLKRMAMKRSTSLQATSTRIRRALIDVGFEADRIFLLPNGVDVARFSMGSRDISLRTSLCGDATIVGVYVGRLSPEKGHELLINSWARVFGTRRDAKLLLVGDGALRDSLLSLATSLNIQHQVVFVGHKSDVAPFLAIADFGTLTSFNEGLSNSLLEYMASGLPVIGSRVSGTEDFVVDGINGWLFEPGSAIDLARCLHAAATCDPLALREMGLRAQRHVMNTASLDAVAASLVVMYQSDLENDTLAIQRQKDTSG